MFAPPANLRKTNNPFKTDVLVTFGSFPKLTPIRDLRVAFKIPDACDFITKLFRQQAR